MWPKAIKLLVSIREVPVPIAAGTQDFLNDDPLFSSDPPGKCWEAALNLAMIASFHVLPNSLSTIIRLYSLSYGQRR
jgi:hypothetical protein